MPSNRDADGAFLFRLIKTQLVHRHELEKPGETLELPRWDAIEEEVRETYRELAAEMYTYFLENL